MQRITFQELPRVLIFQLKYFVYVNDQLQKNIKQFDYSMDLDIGPGKYFFGILMEVRAEARRVLGNICFGFSFSWESVFG